MVSAYPIIAIDLYENRLDLAKQLGATHLINSKTCDVRKKVLEIIGEQGADVVVDNTGKAEVIELAYELTSPQGRTILVGVPRKGDHISIYSLPLHFGKILTGSHGGESDPAIDIPRYVNLHQSGRLQLDGLITDEFSLTEINTAIDRMRDGEIAGRCLVQMP